MQGDGTRIEPTSIDGVTFRDLNGNGRLDPFEDPRLSVTERVEDLVQRLDVDELVGLMFHTVIEVGHEGELLAGPGHIAKSGAREVVLGKRLNHFNVHALEYARLTARWHNRLQSLACEARHAIPVTVSTDPRHSVAQNAGTSWAATFFSQWPDPMGLAALRDVDLVRSFFDTVRREYVAVGIRSALHPTVDLATEPRWGRQRETLGADVDFVVACTAVAVGALQGETLGAGSVSATTKHWFAAVTGSVFPEGRLPVEFPRSMDDVRASLEDVGGGTASPLLAAGHGLKLGSDPERTTGQ